MSRWMHAGEIIRMGAYFYPDKMGAKDLFRSLTFKEWDERCCRLANGLLGLGLEKGDKVAIIAYNCIEWMEIYGALAKAGLVAVPIMFRLTPLEYHYILDNSEAKAFIVGSAFTEGVNSIRSELTNIPASNYLFFGDGQAPEGYTHYEDLVAGASAEEPGVEVDHKDTWVIMYTSGTTGKPKGVVRSHESFVAQYLTNIIEFGFNRDDIGLMVMPMCHINAILYSFVFTYTYGGRVRVQRGQLRSGTSFENPCGRGDYIHLPGAYPLHHDARFAR